MSEKETQETSEINTEKKIDEQKQSRSSDILNTLDYKWLKKFNEEMWLIYGENPTPESTLEILKWVDIYKDCKTYDEAMILLKEWNKDWQWKNSNLYHRLKDNVKTEKPIRKDNEENTKIKSNEKSDLKWFCTLWYSKKLEEWDIVINIKWTKWASPIFRLEEWEDDLFYCVNYPKSYPKRMHIEVIEQFKSEYHRHKITSENVKSFTNDIKENKSQWQNRRWNEERESRWSNWRWNETNERAESRNAIIEKQKKEKRSVRNKIKSKRKNFRNIKQKQ